MSKQYVIIEITNLMPKTGLMALKRNATLWASRHKSTITIDSTVSNPIDNTGTTMRIDFARLVDFTVFLMTWRSEFSTAAHFVEDMHVACEW